jgi:uncharacterized membrane protein
MKKLTKYFFEGLIVVLPAAATIYLFYITFIWIDNLFGFTIPGLGFIVTLGIILLTGFIASNIVTRGLINLFHELFRKLPLVKLIYNSIKDLIEAFVGDKKRFNKPVSVKMGDNVEILGFITSDDLTMIGLPGKTAVYIPQSYNFAGNLIVVPSSNITVLQAGAKEIMTFIVSGGLSFSSKELINQ